MKILGSLIFVLTLSVFTIHAGNPDKLSYLRTQKKIIPEVKAQAPYYSVQILALKQPPQAPDFFKNVDVAYEYPCSDGFVRYCVGKFNSRSDAEQELQELKTKGYEQAFIVNTKKFDIKGSSYQGVKEIDPDKIYSVQLSAFRYPVYLTYFKNVDNVMEFRMKDKIFRYTVGRFPGSQAKEELKRVKELGYPDAFLVELDKYMPYKIE